VCKFIFLSLPVLGEYKLSVYSHKLKSFYFILQYFLIDAKVNVVPHRNYCNVLLKIIYRTVINNNNKLRKTRTETVQRNEWQRYRVTNKL